MLPGAPQPYGLLYYPPYWTLQHSPPVPRCLAPLSRGNWNCKPVIYMFPTFAAGRLREIIAAKGGKYVGGYWPVKFSLKMPDFHVAFSELLRALNLHGTHSFTSLPKEGVLRIFSP
jgi:hypothetical protein